jgi:hypothetical protein
MKSRESLKNRTPHDVILEGNSFSCMAVGYYPVAELEKILPKGMSIPSAAVMDEKFPTVKKVKGMHPFLLNFQKCDNVHDVMTKWELRSYREHLFYIPVIYTHKQEEQLCSYVPVLYLEFLLGVIGGLYLSLRKQFRPGMKIEDTDTLKSYAIKGVLDVNFQHSSADSDQEIDPFFLQIFKYPTVTVSYLGQTKFYTTKIYSKRVFDTSHTYQWNYKGSVIKHNKNTFASCVELGFTTSQAMRFKPYFHPTYALE